LDKPAASPLIRTAPVNPSASRQPVRPRPAFPADKRKICLYFETNRVINENKRSNFVYFHENSKFSEI
jgi:hypothetical protein